MKRCPYIIKTLQSIKPFTFKGDGPDIDRACAELKQNRITKYHCSLMIQICHSFLINYQSPYYDHTPILAFKIEALKCWYLLRRHGETTYKKWAA